MCPDTKFLIYGEKILLKFLLDNWSTVKNREKGIGDLKLDRESGWKFTLSGWSKIWIFSSSKVSTSPISDKIEILNRKKAWKFTGVEIFESAFGILIFSE